MKKFFTGQRNAFMRLTAFLLLAIFLTNCAGQRSLTPPVAPEGQSCASTPTVAHADLLPSGAHIDCYGNALDARGRFLIYDGGKTPWLAMDHGVAIDPTLAAVPQKALQAVAQAIRSLPKSASAKFAAPDLDCGPVMAAKPRRTQTTDPCSDGSDSSDMGSGAIMNTAGMPSGTLTLGGDGFYYDSMGGEWGYDYGTGGWLKTIASVISRPSTSEYEPYFIAYSYINGMAPLWWAFALPVPEEGLVPWETLVERFGLRGALAIANRLLGAVLEKLVAELGSDNLLRMTADEANSIMASHGYTNPPFMQGLDAAQFSVDSSMADGQVAGSQLVRVGSDSSVGNGSGWMTTMDQITNTDGSMMSGQEIADRLGLPSAPTAYAPVTSVSTGGEFMVGVANDMTQYGWGSGGGIQYYLLSGNYTIGPIGSIP